MKKFYTIFVTAVLFLIIPSISLAATVTTFATLGPSGNSQGNYSNAAFVFDTAGNLYAVNGIFNTISKITPSGTVTTFATIGTLDTRPSGIVIDAADNLYVINDRNNIISKITPSGTVTTFATLPVNPVFLSINAAGNLFTTNWIYGGPYYASTNGTISKITPSGTVTTFATVCVMPGKPVFDTAGNLYTGCNNDYANTRVLGTIDKITPSGTVSTFATLGALGYAVPMLAFDTAGNLYATDASSASLKKFTPSGTVTTSGAYQVNYPSALAIDSTDNLYIAGLGGNGPITKVTPSGTAFTFASVGPGCFTALTFDTASNLYVMNGCYNTIRKISSSISVYSNVAASWTITGPATITGSGTSQTTLGKPSGTYTITWGAVSGYITPATQSLTLDSMGNISFSGTYVNVPINGGWTGWSAQNPACGYSGTQTRTCTNPAPAYNGAACSGSTTQAYTNAPCPINGSCAATHYSCNAGTSVSNGGNAYVWAWACNGIYDGINDTTCSETKTYTFTPSAGAGGTISPSTLQTVNSGSTKVFTITPNTNYSISTPIGGTCGGTLVGTTYTTSAITANCTVSATFAINTFTVTPSAGAGGTISPSTPQTVNSGSTKVFTITPNTNYSISPPIGGTCGGILVGNTYTTNAITGNCTVSATFIINAPIAPTGFTAGASSCGNNWLNIYWNASTNATNYKVYRNGTLVYDSSGLSFSDTGLTLGTTYPYTITASNAGGTSNPAATSGTVASACPIAGGWSSWGACTATVCGCSGTQTRTCSNPYPANEGADCSGSATQACSAGACSSGTLSATSCVIAKSASTCTSQVTWTTANLTAGATEVTRNNPAGTHLSYNTSGTNVPSTVKYGASSFFLYHNINGTPTLLASTNINASCAPATLWDGSICKNASSMSGTLVPAVSFCNILEGQNSCNLNFSWNTLYPVGVSAVTSIGMANVNGNLGNQAFPIPYTASPRIFYLYNSAIELAKSTVTAKCATGTYWNNSQCVAVSACVEAPITCQDPTANNAGGSLPCTYSSGSGANINADSTTIISGGSTTLTWDGSGSCSGTNFSTGGISSGSLTISPTSTTTYTLTCGTSTDQVTVTVEKKPKFIEH